MATPETMSFNPSKCFNNMCFFEKLKIHARSAATHNKTMTLEQQETSTEAATTVILEPFSPSGLDGVRTEVSISSRNGRGMSLGHKHVLVQKHWAMM